MTETEIQNFWQNNSCGDHQVGGLDKKDQESYLTFFKTYDRFRYKEESHILKNLDNINFKGKKVLEIGLGQGADSQQLIKRGAKWSGLDLTEESVGRVKTRLEIHKLPFDEIKQGSILEAPYPDNTFDIVFSHGVLHHIPDIQKAQKEIARVLKPNGQLIIMVYAKWSLNYLFSIGFVRRLGLILMKILNVKVKGIYAQHLKNANKIGLFNYLKMSNFIHRNTDGPLNPYAKVYDVLEIEKDFSEFNIIKSYKSHMHAPPLRVKFLPLAGLLGWHLWAHLSSKK